MIGVNLNGSRFQDALCPPAMKPALAVYTPFGDKIVSHAMDDWPAEHVKYRKAGKSGPFYYRDEVFKRLGA